MRTSSRFVLVLGFGVAFAACSSSEPDGGPTPLTVEVPAGFPPVPVPADAPLTVEAVALGAKLFADPILSRDLTISCATCHDPDNAFTDGRTVSVGIDGRTGFRNAPTILNVAYHTSFFHDGGALFLEGQALAPIESENEMDANLAVVLERLNADPAYRDLFDRAFGTAADVRGLTVALASFERTLVSDGSSRYDRFVAGDATALTAQEQLGKSLFTGRLSCATCHPPPLFSTFEFQNPGAYSPADSGRARITQRPEDKGKFKVPSLRNVARTAPYFHDGRYATLEEAVHHFLRGGDGLPGQSPHIRPQTVTGEEREALVAFLRSLSDEG